MKNSSILIFKAVTISTILVSSSLLAQKSGQSVQIQYGVVVGSKYVQQKSDAGKGALVGGAIGLYTAKGKSSGKKFRRGTAGVIAGGAATSAVQGSLDAREYQIRTTTGSVVILSDQTEIKVDDCVIIENAGGRNANIRRVAATYCDPASADVVASLHDEAVEEAQECLSAKSELAAAENDAAVDRALRKISILCDT